MINSGKHFGRGYHYDKGRTFIYVSNAADEERKSHTTLNVVTAGYNEDTKSYIDKMVKEYNNIDQITSPKLRMEKKNILGILKLVYGLTIKQGKAVKIEDYYMEAHKKSIPTSKNVKKSEINIKTIKPVVKNTIEQATCDCIYSKDGLCNMNDLACIRVNSKNKAKCLFYKVSRS